MTLQLLGSAGDGRSEETGVLYSNDIRVLVDVCVRGVVEEHKKEGGGGRGGGGLEDDIAMGGRMVHVCRGLYVRVLERVVMQAEFSADRSVYDAQEATANYVCMYINIHINICMYICM